MSSARKARDAIVAGDADNGLHELVVSVAVHRRRVADDFAERYGDLLTGSYDCVDRVVLNAYFPMGHNPGGFRCWWRRLHGSDDQLDDTHMMRMAGRFARRVKAWAAANGVPVIFCKAGERKHLIAERVPGGRTRWRPVCSWSWRRGRRRACGRCTARRAGSSPGWRRRREHVYHYSFHIMDPAFGHLAIKMSGHPPFGAQVILNGHEYVAVAAQARGDRVHQGGQLLYWDRGSAGPGPGRRCLAAVMRL